MEEEEKILGNFRGIFLYFLFYENITSLAPTLVQIIIINNNNASLPVNFFVVSFVMLILFLFTSASPMLHLKGLLIKFFTHSILSC